MQCYHCKSFTLGCFCSTCKEEISHFHLTKRKLDCGLTTWAFHPYSGLEDMVKYKHSVAGYFVLKALARLTFKRFAKLYQGPKASVVALDDRCSSGYSHTAILAKALNCEALRYEPYVLHASTNVKYAGQTLLFRQKHKRDYKLLKKPSRKDVILVDDVVTTGTSLCEAKHFLKKNGFHVLCALVLTDVGRV